MAELIQKEDTLNQGRVKLNNAILDAEKAKNDAATAKEKAETALANSESTQRQLDTIVIEGDSSVEAAQARVDEKGEVHPTLKARIDYGFTEVSNQLAQNARDLRGRGVNVETFNRLAPEVSDSGRIQRALDSLEAGGLLLLPNKLTEYEISTPVILKDNTIIEGHFTKVSPTSITRMFDVSNTKNVTIRGLLFDLGEFDDVNSQAIYGENVEDLIIDKCFFLNGSTGIRLYNVKNTTVQYSTFKDNRHWSVHVSGCDGLKYLYNISSHQKTYDGLKVSGGGETDPHYVVKNVLIQGNMCFLNKRDGIDIACKGGYNILIKDNILYNNEENGIDFKIVYFLAQEDGRTLDLFDSVIEGNVIIDSGYKGINVQADVGLIRDILITKNIVRFSGDNSVARFHGIQTKNTKRVRIIDNEVSGFYCAIRLSDTNKSYVKGNHLKDNRRDVMLDVQQYNEMSDNVVTENILETEILFGNERIYVLNQGVRNTKIHGNTYDYPAVNRPVNDNGTGTVMFNNLRGYSTDTPTFNSNKGDIVINTDIGVGKYEKWVCIQQGSGYWRGVNMIT